MEQMEGVGELETRREEERCNQRGNKRRWAKRRLSYDRMAPRAAYAISLEYHNDFDEHGLFYYIGTNAGKEEWSNPGMRGRVRVTCSSQVGFLSFSFFSFPPFSFSNTNFRKKEI